MTLLWIAIWLALSVFIIGIFIWTTRALQEQKAVWKKFAAGRQLEFTAGHFFQSASLRGAVNGYDLLITSEQRGAADLRGRKFVTLFQFGLPDRLPAPAVIGSGDYRAFVDSMPAADSLQLDFPGWTPETVLAKTDDRVRVLPYFTPERLRVLDSLIKQKNASVLFLFDERNAYLRLETTDPMLKPGQLDKVIDSVIPLLKALAP